jgi:hypothetical protein
LVILKLYAKKPEESYTFAEIQKKTKLPLATAFRQLKALAKQGFLSVEKIKHVHVYRLAHTDVAQTIVSLLYEHPEPLRVFLEKAENLDTVEEVAMTAKTENSATIVVVGHAVDKAALNEQVAFVLDRYSYKISHVVLEPEQYAQMQAMGLYPTKPQVLYRKL